MLSRLAIWSVDRERSLGVLSSFLRLPSSPAPELLACRILWFVLGDWQPLTLCGDIGGLQIMGVLCGSTGMLSNLAFSKFPHPPPKVPTEFVSWIGPQPSPPPAPPPCIARRPAEGGRILPPRMKESCAASSLMALSRIPSIQNGLMGRAAVSASPCPCCEVAREDDGSAGRRKASEEEEEEASGREERASLSASVTGTEGSEWNLLPPSPACALACKTRRGDRTPPEGRRKEDASRLVVEGRIAHSAVVLEGRARRRLDWVVRRGRVKVRHLRLVGSLSPEGRSRSLPEAVGRVVVGYPRVPVRPRLLQPLVTALLHVAVQTRHLQPAL
eukprot:750399-Hanusia_phi.AAC.2